MEDDPWMVEDDGMILVSMIIDGIDDEWRGSIESTDDDDDELVGLSR